MPEVHDEPKSVTVRPKRWPQLVVAMLAVPMFALAVPSPGAMRQVDVIRLADTLGVTGPHRWLPTTDVDAGVRPVKARKAVPVTPGPLVAQTTALPITSLPTSGHLVSLIHRAFPPPAWRDAVAIAWCESKFHPNDIGFDSNGTHDRGLFQLNDGGTQQYLFKMLGFNPNDLALGFNPVLNVRAAALLFARDGWSQWSCASTLTS